MLNIVSIKLILVNEKMLVGIFEIVIQKGLIQTLSEPFVASFVTRTIGVSGYMIIQKLSMRIRRVCLRDISIMMSNIELLPNPVLRTIG